MEVISKLVLSFRHGKKKKIRHLLVINVMKLFTCRHCCGGTF